MQILTNKNIMNKTYKKTSFSLIELLFVMAISIILIGIAIPAFNSLTKGQKVEIAARSIGSQLKAVRSHAITNRKYTALIIPTPGNPAGLSANYYYNSYRSCIVNSSDVFQEWVFGEKWEFMPTGTAILEIDNSISLNTVKNFDSATTITGVDFGGLVTGLISDAKGIIFTPTGKCIGATAAGIFVNVGDSIALEDGVSTTSNQIDIKIDLYSGRISYRSN